MKIRKILSAISLAMLLAMLLSGCKETVKHTKVTKSEGEISSIQNCDKQGHVFEEGACTKCNATFSDALEFELNSDGESYAVVEAEKCKDEEVFIPAEYNGLPVTVIGKSAFYGSLAKRIYIPYTVKIIEDSAFHKCRSLLTVEFEEGSQLQFIGEDAFLYSEALSYINLPESLVDIGREAFWGCASLITISIPDNVTHIGVDAFSGTDYYRRKENWENGILYIGNYLVAVDKELSGKCVVKEGITLLADNSFASCQNLIIVDLPSSLEIVGEGAFSNCVALEYVNFNEDNNLKKISSKVFVGCETFLRITYGRTAEEWEKVEKDKSWNYNLNNYIIHCYDTDIT